MRRLMQLSYCGNYVLIKPGIFQSKASFDKLRLTLS
jgi:hypothetical protein